MFAARLRASSAKAKRVRARGLALATSAWLSVAQAQSIQGAVCAATRVLKLSRVPEAAHSAQYLAVSAFSNVQTTTEARFSERQPRSHELQRFIQLCRQRQRQRTPIQYLVGDWDFHGVTLLVRAPVLIPRPETEQLVELLLRDVAHASASILDVGCGSGAILAAALAARPQWRALGIDSSADAVELSRENVELLRLQQRATILQATLGDVCARGVQFDALVSNPPYIPAAEMATLQKEVKDHEDFNALCGGEDGMDVIREVLQLAAQVVKVGASIWLEVDTSHPAVLQRMQFEQLEYVATHTDLNGAARFCHLRRRCD